MTTIKVSCEFCGDRELKPADLWLTLKEDDSATVEFDCDSCGTPNTKPAHAETVSVLLAVGVEYVEAAPLPGAVQHAIDDSLRRCRQTAIFDLEAEFRDELNQGDTLDAWGLA